MPTKHTTKPRDLLPAHPPPMQPLPSISPQRSSDNNGKKKKKKKPLTAKLITQESEYSLDLEHDEDDEDIPPLQSTLFVKPSTMHRTGLSPELQSVHLSATASLSASAAAAAKSNPTAAAQVELMAAADDLCRRMDADPQGGLVDDDDYWASLPAHIRNFVRNTHSQTTSPGNERAKAQHMYDIAQQMVQSGVKTHSLSKTMPGYPPGTQPSLPLDPSVFSRSHFNAMMMEQVAAAYSPSHSPPLHRENHYYSEDEHEGEFDEEQEEDEISSAEVNVPRPPAADIQLSHDTLGAALVAAAGNNSKSYKVAAQPPGTAMTPADGAPGPNKSPAAVSVTTNAMPPSTRAPPPSSRAAGKQPMSYPAPPANTNPSSTTRSVRAASKQPLSAAYPHNPPHHHPSPPSSNASGPHKPRSNLPGTAPPAKNNKIWSTSSTEERERIKDFWLGLGEEERRNLVRVEKEAVLKKMKEQQKHSCSCAVCGRKRNAIEEELEVLYDAYYEELEQYANHQQRYVSSGGTISPPPGPGPFPGSVELDKNGAVVGPHKPHPPSHHPNLRSKNHPPPAALPNGRNKTHVKQPESEFEDDQEDEEYEEEDEYEEDEEDEEDEEEEEAEPDEEDVDGRTGRVAGVRRNGAAPAPNRRRPANDTKQERELFNFGSSLTVTGIGNILTVADDLLKNDGQKFLEMMEQLADRRMQREEEATADVEDASEDDDGDEDDEEEEEEEEDEDDEDDEEEEEPMTEEQKMEEGKKMFSIFAARMFEQRVLQAYREKVAQERQLQLLRELEDEDKASKEKEAKKQTQNQKKKDKKRQQRIAKEGEKAAKAAEKAAEDAALRAKQLAMEDEQRKKRDEERIKREAARKAADDEKKMKEEERRREKDREAERERKKKENQDKVRAERREREEKERQVREEREVKVAAEKAAAAAKLELQVERKRREEKERAERAEKERANQQRSLLKNQISRPPTSPRTATASGSSSQRSPIPLVPPKKILSKPSSSTSLASPVAVAPPARQPQQRPMIVTSQISGHSQLHLAASSSTPAYSPSVNGIIPHPIMSPRQVYTPQGQYNGFGPGPSMQQQQGPSPLAPSALPRTFGAVPTFDPPFNGRAIAPPTSAGGPGPIGPPFKAPPPPPPPQMLAPGANRPSSIIDPGPITRPMAPIARPTTGDTGSASGSGSPVRRSPSPKCVLGSSALAADDDEVVSGAGRRLVGSQVWGGVSAAAIPSPRSSVDVRVPWGLPAPLPGFSPSIPQRPQPIGAPPLPPSSPWAATTASHPDWHPTNFFPASFITHTHNASSPPPHSSGN